MYSNHTTQVVRLSGLDSPMMDDGNLSGVFSKSFLKRVGSGLIGAGAGYTTGGEYGALVGGTTSALITQKGGFVKRGVRSILVGGGTGALTGATLAAVGYEGNVGFVGEFTRKSIEARRVQRRARSKLIGPLPQLTVAERLSGLLPIMAGVQQTVAGRPVQPVVTTAGTGGFDLSPMTMVLIGGGVIGVVALAA